MAFILHNNTFFQLQRKRRNDDVIVQVTYMIHWFIFLYQSYAQYGIPVYSLKIKPCQRSGARQDT